MLCRKRAERHVGDVDAVDQDAAGIGRAQALQERQRGGLAGAGRPDQRDGLAGGGLEAGVEHALVAVPEAEGYVLVADVAGHAFERLGVGFLAHALGGIEQIEEAAQGGRILEDAHGEARQQIELADHQAGKGDERHDLADVVSSALDQHGADRVDGDEGDGCSRAGKNRQQPPPGENGILGSQQLGDDRAHGLHLGGEAGIALHHRDVAEHVADAAVDVVVVLLDGGLSGAGLARHQHVGEHVDDGEHRQDRGQRGVHVDGGRHQHEDADERDELLAQERQPVPEQRVGAGEDGAHHRARAFLGVVADRQDDGVLEGQAKRGETAPVRQAIGHHRHDHAGHDADQADQRPQADDRKGALSEGQRVHDASKQHALERSARCRALCLTPRPRRCGCARRPASPARVCRRPRSTWSAQSDTGVNRVRL